MAPFLLDAHEQDPTPGGDTGVLALPVDTRSGVDEESNLQHRVIQSEEICCREVPEYVREAFFVVILEVQRSRVRQSISEKPSAFPNCE